MYVKNDTRIKQTMEGAWRYQDSGMRERQINKSN